MDIVIIFITIVIIIVITSFLSSLRLQKNLWVISTSRKRAPIEPTFEITMVMVLRLPYPSPEAEDPSKYGNQFLDRPDHLDTSIDMISIKCLLEKNIL